MSAIYRMIPFRLVALLCVGVGIPYLTLATASEALRAAPIPLRFAPTLYLATIAIGAVFFLGLRGTSRANAKVYAICGAILGLIPGGVYQISIVASEQPAFLWMPLLVGLMTGAGAGWSIWRGDDGFSRVAD